MSRCIDCNKNVDKRKRERCINCYVKYKQSLSPLKKCECSPECQEMIHSIATNGHPAKYKKGHCKKGYNSPEFEKGRLPHQGYIDILIPDDSFSKTRRNWRYMREHIYFYEQYHQLCMLPWGDVHHKDFNKENNMIWNLQGMMGSDHSSYHQTKDLSNRICSICGSSKTKINKDDGRPHWFNNPYFNGELICDLCYLSLYYAETRVLKSLTNKLYAIETF